MTRTLLLSLLAATLALALLLPLPAAQARSQADTADGITISETAIRNILADYINNNADLVQGSDVSFKSLDLPAPFTLPSGKVEVDVIPSDPSIVRSRAFTLIFRVNDAIKKNIAVRGDLQVFAPVVVASADIPRGAIVRYSDLSLVRLDISDIKNPSFRADEVVGKVATRSLRQGKPIDSNSLRIPPVVNKGELVTITLRRGPMTITAKGVAHHDAKRNESVVVRNNTSDRDIICRASAPGHVEVEI